MNQITVVRFFPKDWEKHRDGLMELENASFDDPELCMTEEEKEECMTDPDVYAYIALDGERVVGETYGNILQKTDKDEFFEGHWDPASYVHYDKKTLYITSTATHPDYRGHGIAKMLKYEMFKDLKKDGFEYAIGHSNDGAMTAIESWFNGELIGTFEHWYGSEETHNLMEVDLSKLPVLLPVNHLVQLGDYDCGIASVAVLMGFGVVPQIDEKKYGLSPEIGISHEDLVNYSADIYEPKLSTKYNSTIEDIVGKISNRTLVMVNYQFEGDGHYSVVFGYDKDNVYILDVSDGKEKKIKNEVFEKIWYSKMFGYRWIAWF